MFKTKKIVKAKVKAKPKAKMTKCKECGEAMPAGSKKCPDCGKKC